MHSNAALDCRLVGLSRLRDGIRKRASPVPADATGRTVGMWVALVCSHAGMSPAELRAMATHANLLAENRETMAVLMKAETNVAGAA